MKTMIRTTFSKEVDVNHELQYYLWKKAQKYKETNDRIFTRKGNAYTKFEIGNSSPFAFQKWSWNNFGLDKFGAQIVGRKFSQNKRKYGSITWVHILISLQLYQWAFYICTILVIMYLFMYLSLALICQLLKDHSQHYHSAWHILDVQKLVSFIGMNLGLDSPKPLDSYALVRSNLTR